MKSLWDTMGLYSQFLDCLEPFLRRFRKPVFEVLSDLVVFSQLSLHYNFFYHILTRKL